MSDCVLRATEPFALRDFLVKQRITISLFVFCGLALKDLVTGIRPHDTGNFHDPLAITGLVTVLVGLAVRSWAAGVINKSKVLATTGPYRLCRHPLYKTRDRFLIGHIQRLGQNLRVVALAYLRGSRVQLAGIARTHRHLRAFSGKLLRRSARPESPESGRQQGGGGS